MKNHLKIFKSSIGKDDVQVEGRAERVMVHSIGDVGMPVS